MRVCICVLFVKQKTAYEMHISDWSTDVCSSDLVARILRPAGRLGLLWNIRDAREPWVAELADILGHQSADEQMLEAGGPLVNEPLQFVESRAFAWTRSEERRVGTEWGSMGRSRWWPYHLKKNKSIDLNTI